MVARPVAIWGGEVETPMARVTMAQHQVSEPLPESDTLVTRGREVGTYALIGVHNDGYGVNRADQIPTPRYEVVT